MRIIVRSLLWKTVWLVVLFASWNGCVWPSVQGDMKVESEACGEKALTARERRARRAVIVFLDPGHGGADYGCYTKTKPKVYEKFLALSTAFLVRDKLRKMGYQVYLSRYSDEYPELLARVDAAQRRRASLYVALHYNSAPSTEARGIEVFYYDLKKPSMRTKESRRMARAVLSGVVQATGARSRGIKQGNFAVIRETRMPAILVEGGFLTNPEELKDLGNQKYMNLLSKGVAEGIDAYVQQAILKKRTRS